MVKIENISDTSVRLVCHVPAKPEDVFDAWTSAVELEKWFGPEPTGRCTVEELEPRAGGAFRIRIEGSFGLATAFGQFTEFDRPTRIQMSWHWAETKPEPWESRVTIDLSAEGDGTRNVLTHDRHFDIEARDNHAEGWTAFIESLVKHFVVGRAQNKDHRD